MTTPFVQRRGRASCLAMSFGLSSLIAAAILARLSPVSSGIALAVSSLTILFLSSSVRSHGPTLVAGLIVWICHQTVAVINLFATVKGAGQDAQTFHLWAVDRMSRSISELPVGDSAALYSSILSVVYRIFGGHLLVGEQMSIIATMTTVCVISRLSRQLEVKRMAPVVILVWGLLPSGLIHRSVTLRESWQALFVALSLSLAITAVRGLRLRVLTAMIVCSVAMGALHTALALYAIGFLLAVPSWYFLRTRGSRKLVAITVILVLMAGLYSARDLVKRGGKIEVGEAIVKGEIGELASQHRVAAERNARANYGGNLDTSSLGSFVLTGAVVVVQYMAAPTPGQISSPLDLYAAAENAARLLLIGFALRRVVKTRGSLRQGVLIVLMLSVFLELIWAAGTVNWGTAVRHHLLAWLGFVVTGLPQLVKDALNLGSAVTGRKRLRAARLVATR